jgi:hypothetical protein
MPVNHTVVIENERAIVTIVDLLDTIISDQLDMLRWTQQYIFYKVK